MKKLLRKYEFVIFGAAIVILFLLALLILINEQEDGRKAAPTVTPTEYGPEATPTPADEFDVVLIDGLATAVIHASFDGTCTNTPTPTEKPTPTPTETPSDVPTATGTPIPTKKPTNTPKPKNAPSVTPKTVQKGKAGTYTVERGGHDWKPYARYQAITAKSSPQYKLQQMAKTDKNGLRYVTVDGVKRYCVAVGVAWCGGSPSDIGRCFDVQMQNGETIHCVLGDVKKIEHSQKGEGRFGSNGELLEFQVDQNKLPDIVRTSGDVSKLGGAFEGNAAKVIVFDKNVLKRN